MAGILLVPNNIVKIPEGAVVIGEPRAAMMKNGKWAGRPVEALATAVKQEMMQKSESMSGIVTTMCVSPDNGVRLPVKQFEATQSAVGDFQSKSGWVMPTSRLAKIKNTGCELLGEENIFVESLLSGISVGDEDIVREVLLGASEPRREDVWTTGDNIYVSGLDMSWDNFHIGDILVLPGAVILHSGFPHFACWKYAVRAGDGPKAYVNSMEALHMRMRGIKGAFLLPSASCNVKTGDSVKIVRKGSGEYKEIVKGCRAPIPDGTQLTFRLNGHHKEAASDDIEAYIDLMVCAGMEAARLDIKKYSRKIPEIMVQALQAGTKGGDESGVMEISDAAKSGDGTTENVGIKVNGKFHCSECRQKFDTEKAQKLHWMFIHDPARHQED